MAWTLAVLMSRGDNSLQRRFTVRISMQPVSDVRCLRRANNENQSGVERRAAREALRSPPDALKTDGGAAANRTMRKGCDPLKAGLAPGAGAWSRCIR